MKKILSIVSLVSSLLSNQAISQCPPPGYPPTGDICTLAPTLCTDLNGYCATLGTNNVQVPLPGCPGNVLNNDEWFSFIAGTQTITLEVIPSNCQNLNGQIGMQGAVYEGGCNGPAIATQCNCTDNPFQLSSNSFIVGQAYYVVFDGCAGDICDFQVNVLAGSTLPVPPGNPGPVSGPTQVCPGATTSYSIPNPNAATYTWTINPPGIGSFSSLPEGGIVDVTWNTTGTATICVTASNPCLTNPNPSCITVTSANLPQGSDTYDLCVGDCVTCAGMLFCAPTPPVGTPVTLTSWLGCDSIIVCHINGIPPIQTNLGQIEFCGPSAYQVCNEVYLESGIYYTDCTSYQGCDSTVIVDLAIFEPEAIINTPVPVLGCGANASVILNASNSPLALNPGATNTFLWTGPGIVGSANDIVVTVNQPGQYCFTITHQRNGLQCSDMACVTVTQNAAVPQVPQINGNASPCQGTSANYTVTPVGTPAPTGYTWTTPNGEPITQVNPTTISVQWNNATGGQLCVTANNGCGPSSPACFVVNVQAAPVVPIINGPASACANNQAQNYTVTNVQPGVTYSWTVPPGASYSGSGSNIAVNFNGATPGTGQVCATAMNACGTSQPGCTSVTVTGIPATPTLNGPATVCSSGGTYTYSVGSPVAGITYNWTAPPGATINGTGSSVTIDFNGASNGQVCVSAGNACGTSNQACQTVQVVQAPMATISGSGSFCAGVTANINLTINVTGTGPWDVGYSLNGGAPTMVTIQTSPYTLQVSQAGTYTITSVSGGGNCPGTFSGTATVTENPAPTATLSGNGSICQGSGQQFPLNIALTGTAPWTVNWQVGANAQAPLTINASPFTLNIGQSQAGSISLTGVTDGNQCTGTVSGTGTVTINTAPTVSMVSTECDPTNVEYTVTFTINGGDPASYSVTPPNGQLNNGVFVSNPIPTGDGYSFVVNDANDCNPVTVSDNAVICNCTTAAGSMDLTPFEICGDGPETIPYDTTGQAFDGDDILVYILHSGNSVNVVAPVYSVSVNPEVMFIPASMTYGTTYYLSAVVGNDDGAGGVDLDDPCLAVAQGTPVTFNEIPTATLSGNPSICDGDNATLTVDFTGEGPWSIIYEDGNGNSQTVNGITSNPYSLVVNPTSTTTFCLTGLNDSNCPGTFSGCSDVTVNSGVGYTNLMVACNATSTAYTVSFTITGGDPASYFVTGVTGTINIDQFTSNPIPAGSGYNLMVNDANGCDPQTISQSQIICNCSTDAGEMVLSLLEECGDGPITADTLVAPTLDGDDVVGYYLHTNSGTNLGTVIATNSTPSFSFDANTMSYGTTYYISSVVGNDNGSGGVDLGDPCLSVAPGTPVVFYEVPTASMSGSAEICPGESAELMIALTGDSPWSVTINGQVINNIVGTPYAYTVNPGTTTDYLLTSVSDEHCTNTATGTETITVHNPPAIAGVDVACNATGTAYTVCIDILNGDPSCYSVTPNTGTLTGSQFCSDEIPSDQLFTFQVSDCHGCPPDVVQDSAICNCLSAAGNMVPDTLSVCGNAMAVATYDTTGQFLDADDALCYILHAGNSNNPIATNSNAPSFAFNAATMSYGQTYYICAVVGNNNGSGCVNLSDPCKDVGGCALVTFHAVPTATLSGNTSICSGQTTDLSVTLTGAGPWNFIYQNAAGNPVPVTATSSPWPITVMPSSSNVYTLMSLQDNFCPGTVSGSVLVNVNTPPQIVNETYTCDASALNYTVSFEIIGGDPASYTVEPAGSGTLNGNIFTSNPIGDNLPFTFEVDDVNNCGPAVLSDVHDCECLTDAGSFSNISLVGVCLDETLTISATLTGTVLDPDDNLVYVLRTNNGTTLGTVLASSSTPSFDFIPGTLTPGVQYFVSAVAGNSDGSGGVDFNDNCLDVSPGIPVIFYALPTINISGTTAICEGDTATVAITLTGSPPFDVEYLLNGIPQQVTLPVNSLALALSPPASTTVMLVSVTDGNGCSNSSSQSATITVNQPVEAGVPLDPIAFCAGSNQSIDLDAQLTGADPGGAWTDQNGNGIPGGNLSTGSLAAGEYSYTYFLDAAAPCPDDQATVLMTIHPQPVADAGQNQQITCDVVQVTLGGNGTSPNVNYTWTGGNVSDPAIANPNTTVPGTYTLTVSNDFGCSDSDVVTIGQSVTMPEPYFSGVPVSCFGEEDGFIVLDSIIGGNPPYLFSFNNGPFVAQQQFTSLAPGSYLIEVEDNSGCMGEATITIDEPAEVTVKIMGDFASSDPVILLGESTTLSLESTPPYFELDTVIWAPIGIDSCRNCERITIAPVEQTFYKVLVEKNGCDAEAGLTVFVKKERPIFAPNVFSPNEDGVNDIFRIFGGSSVANIKSFLIFNRWGETVYEYYNMDPQDPMLGWDGYYRGKKLNPAVFTWFADIEFKDGSSEIYEGDVILMK
ncbi:MAG: gliding motility-associated C-terminal domain-containing protein [Saprospiraceae bacterium]